MALRNEVKLLLVSMTLDDYLETSEPDPMAMPMSACSRLGLSLTLSLVKVT